MRGDKQGVLLTRTLIKRDTAATICRAIIPRQRPVRLLHFGGEVIEIANTVERLSIAVDAYKLVPG